MLATSQELRRVAAQVGLAPQPATGIGDVFGATRRLTRAERNPALVFQPHMQRTLDALHKITGNPDYDAETSDWGGYQSKVYASVLDAAEADILALRDSGDERATGLLTMAEIRERSQEQIARMQAGQADVSERAGGLANVVGGFGGAMAAGLQEPLTVLSMPFAAAAGASVLTTALFEGAVAGGTEVLLQPSLAQSRAVLGEDLTPGQAAANVATAAVSAGLFAGTLKGVARLLGRFDAEVAAGRIEATPERMAARDAVAEHAEIVAQAPVKTAAGEEMHMRALDGAVREVREGRVPEVARLYEDASTKAAAAAEDLRVFLTRPNVEAEVEAALLRAEQGGPTVPERPRTPGIAGALEAVAEAERLPRLLDAIENVSAREGIGADVREVARVQTAAREMRTYARLAEAARVATERARAVAKLADRVQDGVLLDRSASGTVRPFKTRKAAAEFAAKTLKDRYEVVKSGRGFGLVPEMPEPVRIAHDAVLAANDVALEPGTTARAQAAHATEVESRRAHVEAETAQTAQTPKPDAEVEAAADADLAARAAENPQEPVIVGTDENGNPVYATAEQAAAQFESEKGYLAFMKECMFGG